jgi:hypothetical protein
VVKESLQLVEIAALPDGPGLPEMAIASYDAGE